MASELQISLGLPGRQIYAVIRNQTSGFVWSLSGSVSGAFEAFTSGNWRNYAVSMNEQGVAGYYVGNFPPTIPAGVYAVEARQQIGADPTQLDPRMGANDYQWNGSVVPPLADTATSGQLGQFFPIKAARGVMIQNFLFDLVSAVDHITPFTSGVVSGQILRDNGSFGVLQSGAVTEKGLGVYAVNLTSGDLNANTVSIVFTGVNVSGGASDPRRFFFVMQRTSGQ